MEDLLTSRPAYRIKITVRVRRASKDDPRYIPRYTVLVMHGEDVELRVTLPSIEPLIQYLEMDGRYSRGRDYDIVISERQTKVGEVRLPEFVIKTRECFMRLAVVATSLVGVRDISKWSFRMVEAVFSMPIESVIFWYSLATDWYKLVMVQKHLPSREKGLRARRILARVGKAMRTLYEKDIREVCK